MLRRPERDEEMLSLSAKAKPSFSETGVIAPPTDPDADLAVLRSRLEVTNREMALRRCLVAKFLLPSSLEVGLAFNSSIAGGPRG